MTWLKTVLRRLRLFQRASDAEELLGQHDEKVDALSKRLDVLVKAFQTFCPCSACGGLFQGERMSVWKTRKATLISLCTRCRNRKGMGKWELVRESKVTG